MAVYPGDLPVTNPANHGVVKDEVRAIATYAQQGIFAQSGFWYRNPLSTGSSNHAPGTTGLHMTPMWLPYGTQIVNLGEWLNTAGTAGAVRRLGIYDDDGTFYPGSLLAEGTYAADGATGFQSVTAFSAITVNGWCWVGGVSQTAISTVAGQSVSVPGLSIGSGTPTNGNGVYSSYLHNSVTGALPSTFTSTRTITNGLPNIYFKLA